MTDVETGLSQIEDDLRSKFEGEAKRPSAEDITALAKKVKGLPRRESDDSDVISSFYEDTIQELRDAALQDYEGDEPTDTGATGRRPDATILAGYRGWEPEDFHALFQQLGVPIEHIENKRAELQRVRNDREWSELNDWGSIVLPETHPALVETCKRRLFRKVDQDPEYWNQLRNSITSGPEYIMGRSLEKLRELEEEYRSLPKE